jgi:hypothetical protein
MHMYEATEDEVQAAVVEYLQLVGCTVLVTSRRRKRCAGCGRVSAGGDGATKGVPDLLVSHPRFPEAMWLGVEIKNRKGKLSREQAALHNAHQIVLVRSVQDAVRLYNERIRWDK